MHRRRSHSWRQLHRMKYYRFLVFKCRKKKTCLVFSPISISVCAVCAVWHIKQCDSKSFWSFKEITKSREKTFFELFFTRTKPFGIVQLQHMPQRVNYIVYFWVVQVYSTTLHGVHTAHWTFHTVLLLFIKSVCSFCNGMHSKQSNGQDSPEISKKTSEYAWSALPFDVKLSKFLLWNVQIYVVRSKMFRTFQFASFCYESRINSKRKQLQSVGQMSLTILFGTS